MKRVYALPVVLFFFYANSQNVGIGTSAPTSRLQINHSSASAPAISLVDSSANGAGLLRFRNIGQAKHISLSGYQGNNTSANHYLDVISDSIFIATFRGNGNVGIGDQTPSEKLDLNGNMNINGNIKVNGIAGQNRQILMTNSGGDMVWSDMSEFTEHVTFSFTSAGATQNWTVPAGVTKIRVETWGGGGGGSPFGGGGGGGYITGYFTVTPGAIVSLVVGDNGVGGNAASTTDNSGTASTVTANSITLTATGGGGSYIYDAAPVQAWMGRGGIYSVSSSSFRNWFGIGGSDGQPTRLNYIQASATNFLEETIGGAGGNGGNTVETGSTGGYNLYNTTSSSQLRYITTGRSKVPGGGGGGNYHGPAYTGGAGAEGRVVIHY